MGVNLVPFPRLHFFAIGQAPILSPADAAHVKVNYIRDIKCGRSSRNFLGNIKPEDENIYAHRGYGCNVQTQEVDVNE